MKIRKVIYYGTSLILNRLFRLMPFKKKSVLFLSDVRKDLSGNFEPIYNALDNSFNKELSLKGDRREQRSLKDFFRLCYAIGTFEYILLDDYSEATAFVKPRKKQKIVQLWHGSGAFKKFAHSRTVKNGNINHIHPGYKWYTNSIDSSEHINECYAEAFSIPVERVIPTGVPRTDIFFDNVYIKAKQNDFFNKHPELAYKKIILFVPTYRGAKVEDADYDFDKLDLDKLYNELSDEYVLIIKWHPALYNNIEYGKSKGLDIEKYKDFVYDMSDNREVNDLLFVTDILITDYSSIIFDYALLNKPIVYFMYDLAEYENDRGFYFPLEEYIYGPIAKTSEELIECIKSNDMCIDKRKVFTEKFINKNDGHATERVIETIFNYNRRK